MVNHSTYFRPVYHEAPAHTEADHPANSRQSAGQGCEKDGWRKLSVRVGNPNVPGSGYYALRCYPGTGLLTSNANPAPQFYEAHADVHHDGHGGHDEGPVHNPPAEANNLHVAHNHAAAADHLHVTHNPGANADMMIDDGDWLEAANVLGGLIDTPQVGPPAGPAPVGQGKQPAQQPRRSSRAGRGQTSRYRGFV